MEKTPELYNQWNSKKQKIEYKYRKMIVKKWEIWTCHIGLNIGSEISKDGGFRRPVLVLQTWIWGDLVLVAPLTSKYNKSYHWNYFSVENYQLFWLKEPSWFVINQIKTLSFKRLHRKLNNIIVNEQEVPLVSEKVMKSVFEHYVALIWNGFK